MAKRCKPWFEASEINDPEFFEVKEVALQEILVSVRYDYPDLHSNEMVNYRIFGSGDILLSISLKCNGKDNPELPRLGLNLEVKPGFSNLEWYGRGPWENYQDRNSSAFLGLYNSTVDEQFVPYVRPQENGYKTDVRWLALTGKDNKGIFIQGDPQFCFSALPYTYDDMKGFTHGGKHPVDLQKQEFIDLNIDYKQMGVGGDDSWGAKTHSEYMLPAKDYSYSFRFRPYSRDKDIPEKLASQRFALPTE
jgi:beta-galactosidase